MKRWLGFVGPLVLLVAFGVDAHAQRLGFLQGRVVDENGDPVAGVKIEFVVQGGSGSHYTTESNKKGEFIQTLLPAQYRMTLTKEGYQGNYRDIRVSSDHANLGDVPIQSLESLQQERMAPILEGIERASELADAGQMDEAAAVYQELTAEYPDIAELHYNLAGIYRRQEKWVEAEAELQKALELQPANVPARLMLADALKHLGRTEEALATMDELLAENPDDPQVYYELGIYYLNAQNHEEAYAAFDKVRTLSPENVTVHYLLGTLCLNLGRIEEAVAHLETYLEKAPEDAENRKTATALVEQIQKSEQTSTP